MHATGDENCGVHVCRKCRWPFPNPHPSSRHRRAHKRVCGTIEGYKLNDSENPSLSDEDRHSDEDHKTLSPKVVDRNGTEKRSSGIGERSIRSDDEVFSDAVTDFPDSGFSPGTEQELGGTRASLTSVENIDEKDLTTFYSFKDSAFSDIIESPNNLTDASVIQNPGISGSTSNLSGSHLESQVHVCTPHEEPIAFLGDDKVKLTSETYSTVAETPTHSSQETKVINVVNDATEGMATHAGEVNDAKQNDKINLVTSGAATSITEYAGQTDGTVCKSQETMEMQLDHTAANEVLSEEQGESTTFKTSTVEHVNFDDTDSSKVVAEQGLESNVFFNLNEGYNGSGNEKGIHEISLPSDIPVVEHDIMLEDFKDPKGVKLHNSVPLTLAEIDQKNDVEELFSIDNFTSFRQVQPCDVTKASASDMNMLDDNVTHEHNKSVVNDLSTTGESGLHHVKLTGKEQSDDLGASEEALIVEMEKSLKTGVSENQQPCHANNKHSDTSVPENAVKVADDMSSLHDCGKGGNVVAMHDATKDGNTMPVHDATKDGNTVHVHDATKDATAVVVLDVANNTEAGAVRYSATDDVLAGNGNMNGAGKDEKALDAICSVDEKDDKVRVKEENHTKNVATAIESAADPITNSYESDVTGGSGKGEPNNCDVLGVEDKVVPTEVMHALKKSEMVLKSASTLPESQLVTEDVVNVSANKLPETEFTNRDGVLDTGNGVDELRIIGVDQSQEFITGENGKAIIKDKSLEEHSKNVLPCLYTEPSMQDSVSGGNNRAGELTEEDSVIKESKRERNNSNDFVKPQIGAAVDVVADSLSHTDSLENNWGSISVLSTQSDTPPVVDTQSAASVVVEGTNSQKPNVVSEGQQSEKSDVFEAPSFMTLVEPGGEGDRNSASDIKILPNTQQQNAASLQAGWFPSLTHVVNESQGRKKNEEIIAKVTNWSSGKQHTPLKYLLGEAKSPNRKDSQASEVEKDETKAAKDNGSAPATVSSILGPEGELGNTEKEKDWNSPARYQTDIKREKRRPLWVQFICCSSMN